MIEHSMPTIGREEKRAIDHVLKSKYLAEGEVVKKFEEELSHYVGSKGAVATSTGTLALHLALLSLDIGKYDEVIIPNYVCRSVLNAVLYCGAKPVLCDVNEEDFNISFADARKNITKKTKAIIIPHMFGCPVEIDKFKNFGISIIEDCAHSVGAEFKDRKVGSWGDLSVFSFEGTKYIVAGEGGMVLANSFALLKRIRRLKDPDGLDHKIKYTYRMTDLQAAIGRAQLSKLKAFIQKRRMIAKTYDNAFRQFNVGLPITTPEKLHVFHRYIVKIKTGANTLMLNCYKRGIKVKRPVKPFLLNRYLRLPNKNYPNSLRIIKRAVSIPIYPSLNDGDVQHIITTVSGELKKIV